MDTVRAVEEEFWTVQYQTGDAFRHTLRFWPPDGEGQYDSEGGAIAGALNAMNNHGSNLVRVVHVTRRMEFSKPFSEVKEPDGHSQAS